MKYDLVIFDLDGTTLNTLEDLTDACNTALRANGFPVHDIEKIRTSIGSGIANLIRLTVPDGTDDETCSRVLAKFRTEYSAHLNVKTRPFPGIIEMLNQLRSAGIRIATNSNKIDPAVQALCRAHFPGLTDMVLGERPDIPRKPDPAGVRQIMNALAVDPSRTLYVGDSDIDILTARNAGIDCAWVSWGFRTRAEVSKLDIQYAFDTVDALTDFILS